MLIALLGVAISCEASEAAKRDAPPPPRFSFKIDPKTPLADLLPPAPLMTTTLPGVLNDDLILVPELMFAKPLGKELEFFKSQEATAHRMAKINHLNQAKEDGFLHAFLARRDDLRGLPFLLGKDCRSDEKKAAYFELVTLMVRNQLRAGVPVRIRSDAPPIDDAKGAPIFWQGLAEAIPGFRKSTEAPDVAFDAALVAALMQMITPMSEPYRAGLVKHLATMQHADATRALAKLAIFTPEDSIRIAAVEELKSRTASEYADTLLAGFRYPLPAVSKRAAEALVKTKAKDAAVELIKVLEQPDPRSPAKKQLDGKEVSFIREVVRVNHHHNCLLCHAPANTPDVPKEISTAPVPQPGQALPPPFLGYGSQQSPDIFVRVDMTYLRQDFSMMMKVEDAKPWPEMQRFDFFVRTRNVTATEAAVYAKQLAKVTPPNHAAAQYALRELVGRAPEETTSEGWRRLLKLPR